MPSLARSVPKPLKVPSLARSVQKPLKVPSLARSVLKPLKVSKSDLDLDDDHKIYIFGKASHGEFLKEL